MKKASKKLISILLSAVMIIGVFSILPCSAGALEVTQGDYSYQVLEDGTAEIIGYTGQEENLTIPSTIDDYQVTAIGQQAIAANAYVKSVVIPEGVTTIGKAAFCYCIFLERVLLPSTLVTIGDSAFEDCPLMTSVIIPINVTTIGEHAFGYFDDTTTHLDSFTIYGVVERYGITGSAGEVFATENGFVFSASYMDSEFIYTLKSTGRAVILRYIGEYATVVIPTSISRYTVESIGSKAFEFNNGIRSITLAENIVDIGAYAFANCSNLDSVAMVNGITTIGDYAFVNCPLITSVIVPNSVISIGTKAIGYINDGNSTVPRFKIKGGAGSAANRYATMNRITFEEYAPVSGDFTYTINIDGSIEIQDYRGTDANVVVPATLDDYNVTSIGFQAIAGNNFIETVEISEGITSIGVGGISFCDNLTSITIPKSLTELSFEAFSYNPKLKNITVPSTVTTIGNNAFGYSDGQGTKVEGFTITGMPNSAAETYAKDNGFEFVSLLEYAVLEDGTISITNFDYDDVNLDISATINDYTVTQIADHAFDGNSSLASVTIPDTVVSIGEYAFSNSGLKTVTIPRTVTTIGNYAFGYADEQGTKVEGFTIAGKANSAAEAYATDNGFEFIEVPSNIVGDVNLDEAVNIIDVTVLQKYLVKLEEFTDAQLALADFDGNGVVNIKDGTAIQKALVIE